MYPAKRARNAHVRFGSKADMIFQNSSSQIDSGRCKRLDRIQFMAKQ